MTFCLSKGKTEQSYAGQNKVYTGLYISAACCEQLSLAGCAWAICRMHELISCISCMDHQTGAGFASLLQSRPRAL